MTGQLDIDAVAQLWAVQKVINTMPAEDQARVKECADRLRSVIDEYGDIGYVALAMLGATEATK